MVVMKGLEMGTNTGDRSPKDQEGSFGGSVEPGSTRDDRECRRRQRMASSESEVASLLALCKRRCVHHRLVPSSAVRWGGRIDLWGPGALARQAAGASRCERLRQARTLWRKSAPIFAASNHSSRIASVTAERGSEAFNSLYKREKLQTLRPCNHWYLDSSRTVPSRSRHVK